VEWRINIRRISQPLNELILGNNVDHLWNPRAKIVVTVMSKCKQFENNFVSRAFLKHLWDFGVMKAAVLFLNFNHNASNDLQQKTTDSAQGTYLELHTWDPLGIHRDAIQQKELNL
jgi:hypothetical protein